MSTLTLTTPTTMFGDPEIVSGFDITAISGTGIAGANTVTCPWVPGLLLYVLGASGNTVTLTFIHPFLAASNYTTGNITSAHAVLFGPIPSVWCGGTSGLSNVNNGLVTLTITGAVTGMTFKPYLSPTVGGYHSPFEMAGANSSDY